MQDESQSVMPSAIPPAHSMVVSDDIEFLGTVACSAPDSPSPKRRTAATKRKIYVDDDGDDESKNCTVLCSLLFWTHKKLKMNTFYYRLD